MVERKRNAKPGMDMGAWKHVESSPPYETWEKSLPGGGTAQVRIADTSPKADDDYWAHVEYNTGDGWEWSGEELPSGDSRKEVIRRTRAWMRRNQDWKPKKTGPRRESASSTDLSFGFGGSEGGDYWL